MRNAKRGPTRGVRTACSNGKIRYVERTPLIRRALDLASTLINADPGPNSLFLGEIAGLRAIARREGTELRRAWHLCNYARAALNISAAGWNGKGVSLKPIKRQALNALANACVTADRCAMRIRDHEYRT